MFEPSTWTIDWRCGKCQTWKLSSQARPKHVRYLSEGEIEESRSEVRGFLMSKLALWVPFTPPLAEPCLWRPKIVIKEMFVVFCRAASLPGLLKMAQRLVRRGHQWPPPEVTIRQRSQGKGIDLCTITLISYFDSCENSAGATGSQISVWGWLRTLASAAR